MFILYISSIIIAFIWFIARLIEIEKEYPSNNYFHNSAKDKKEKTEKEKQEDEHMDWLNKYGKR
jgi:hypothetical protein